MTQRQMTRTWPEDWEARKQGAGCWFCGNQLGQPFYAGTVGDAHLERHAIARGHAIVVFRGRHVADFTSLSTSEVAAYWHDIHSVAQMIEHVFAPCHMNYQLLGNSVPHLHWHLIPRHDDDPMPRWPVWADPGFVALTEAGGAGELDDERRRSIATRLLDELRRADVTIETALDR